MALTVQNLQGGVVSANSYASLELMKAHHAERGADLSSFSDDRLSQALVLATDFLDSRYSFVGVRLSDEQGTACPRFDVTEGPNDLLSSAQWTALTKACCMLAYRDLKKAGGLMPDPTFDATGQAVSKKTTKVGPIENTVEYTPSPEAAIPSYPAIDLLLKSVGLLRRTRVGGSGTLSRG
jgi:hypothetical protein